MAVSGRGSSGVAPVKGAKSSPPPADEALSPARAPGGDEAASLGGVGIRPSAAALSNCSRTISFSPLRHE